MLPILKMKLRRELNLLLYLVIGFSFYIVFIGGDVLALYRFFTPVYPLVLILLSTALFNIYQSFRSKNVSLKIRNFSLLIFTSFAVFFLYNHNHQRTLKMARLETGLVSSMKLCGEHLKDSGHAQPLTVAASTIGALKYFSEARVIDMLGLTDEFIAHNPEEIDEISDQQSGWKERKFNAGYVLSEKPDYICFSTREKPSSFAERALFTKNEFLDNYFIYPLKLGENFYYNVFKRKTDAERNDNSLSQIDSKYIDKYIRLAKLSSRIFSIETEEAIENLIEEIENICPANFNDHLRLGAITFYRNGLEDRAKLFAEKSVRKNRIDIFSNVILYHLSTDKGEKFTYLNFINEHCPHLIDEGKVVDDLI